jgi:hypothetical protein
MSLACAAAIRWTRVHIAIHQARSADPVVRKRGLAYLRDEREPRGLDVVLERLAREDDPALTELAAYTAMRMRDPRAATALQQQADRQADSILRTKLILFAVRVSDGDYRLLPWLRGGIASDEPWRQAGSAAGLLHLGRVEGAQAALDLIERLPEEPRQFVLGELRTITERMAQAVGHRLSADPDDNMLSLRAFWARHGNTDLLCDALNRSERNDPDWREVERLLHARERAERLLH